jgi:hypothetical protein
MKLKTMLGFCFSFFFAVVSASPRCYILINQQECSSCFNSIPLLERIDTRLKPTLILRKEDERKYTSINKHLLRNSWSRERTIFSDSLFDHFNTDISAVIVTDSSGRILFRSLLKDLPLNLAKINEHAAGKEFVVQEFFIPDSIQLSDYVNILAGNNYYFILDNAFGALYSIPKSPAFNSGIIRKLEPENIQLLTLFRAKTGDTAGFAGFSRVMERMREFKFSPYEFNNIWEENDTLYLLMTLRAPKPRENNEGYVLAGSYFLLKISPSFEISTIYIDQDLNTKHCMFDQVNGFCRYKDHYYFSVFSDTAAPVEYIAGDFVRNEKGKLKGKFLPFEKPVYFREQKLGNNFTSFSVSGTTGFYRIFPCIYDFRNMKMIRLKKEVPETDFSDPLKAKLNFYIYGLSEDTAVYRMVVQEYDKLLLIIADKISGKILSSREILPFKPEEINSDFTFATDGSFLMINTVQNKISIYNLAP